jgi:hypothetical protein
MADVDVLYIRPGLDYLSGILVGKYSAHGCDCSAAIHMKLTSTNVGGDKIDDHLVITFTNIAPTSFGYPMS